MVLEGIDGNVDLTQVIAARELARLFSVARARGAAFTMMPACPVDTFWHEFQTQGAAFSIFCQQHAGGDVAHREAKGYGTIDWVDLYDSMFGEPLPAIWFYSPDGQRFDRDGWETYRRTGEIRLSWDCTPEITLREPVPGQTDSIGGNCLDAKRLSA